MKQQILILWWTDWFWKWWAQYIKKHFSPESEIIVTGRDIEKWKSVANSLWITFCSDNEAYIGSADIVIFSVPIAFMQESIKQLAPKIKKQAIVLDVCSVKQMPSSALKKYCPPETCIVPTHPMFGPYVSTIASQTIILTPEAHHKKDPRYQTLKDYLEDNGARVIEASPKEHDTMMAIVQWLTHFDLFVMSHCVKLLNIDVAQSLQFVSPNYKVLLSFAARYLDQNPKLYADIQMYNPEVAKVHSAFIKSSKYYQKIVEAKDKKAFIKTAQESKNHFWGTLTNEAQTYTDKLIYLMSQQTKFAKKSIGKHIHLRNIYSEDHISWILESFENDILQLDNNTQYHLNEWEIIQ